MRSRGTATDQPKVQHEPGESPLLDRRTYSFGIRRFHLGKGTVADEGWRGGGEVKPGKVMFVVEFEFQLRPFTTARGCNSSLGAALWFDKRLNLVTFLHIRTKVGLYEPGLICFSAAT